MITIRTQGKQFELHLRFSFTWFEKAVDFLGRILSTREVREIEKRKQQELYEAGIQFWWI